MSAFDPKRTSRGPKEQESVQAGQTELSVRRGVVLSVLRVGDVLRGTHLSPRRTCCRFDLCWDISWVIGLGREDGLRCHVRRGCWRGDISLYRTVTIVGNRRLRQLLQRCVRKEQRCNQHQTYHCQKGESWHSALQVARASAPWVIVKPRYGDRSSWTKDLRSGRKSKLAECPLLAQSRHAEKRNRCRYNAS